MSLILSGSEGLSDVDGTAATPAIRGTDTNTGIFFPTADTIAFAEGGAEVARFDSSGNLGIGISSPGYKVTVSSNINSYHLALQGAQQNAMRFSNASGGEGFIVGRSLSSNNANDFFIFDAAAGANRLQIDPNGRVTMPAQPAFHSERNTAFNAASGVIVFENAPTNIGSNYNTSTGRFTAPVAGTYIFLVSFFTNITNAPIDFRITVNGATAGGNATTGTTSVARDCHAHLIRTLAVNDYVEVQAAGFGTNIPAGLGVFQNFSGRLVS